LKQTETLREIEDIYAPHELATVVYRLKGMHAEAIAEQEKLAERLGNKQRMLDIEEIGHVYAHSGYPASLRKSLELKERGYLKPYSAYEIAEDAVELGKNEYALRWLEKAYHDHDFFFLALKVAPEFDSLRPDPRFQALIRRFDASSNLLTEAH
jgi:hypothetical protein